MSAMIFMLVLLSALLHAFWNFATKKVSSDISVLWLGLLISALISARFGLWNGLSGIEQEKIFYALTAGAVQAAYFVIMGEANLLKPVFHTGDEFIYLRKIVSAKNGARDIGGAHFGSLQ